jgi:hypothetical protein
MSSTKRSLLVVISSSIHGYLSASRASACSCALLACSTDDRPSKSRRPIALVAFTTELSERIVARGASVAILANAPQNSGWSMRVPFDGRLK